MMTLLLTRVKKFYCSCRSDDDDHDYDHVDDVFAFVVVDSCENVAVVDDDDDHDDNDNNIVVVVVVDPLKEVWRVYVVC